MTLHDLLPRNIVWGEEITSLEANQADSRHRVRFWISFIGRRVSNLFCLYNLSFFFALVCRSRRLILDWLDLTSSSIIVLHVICGFGFDLLLFLGLSFMNWQCSIPGKNVRRQQLVLFWASRLIIDDRKLHEKSLCLEAKNLSPDKVEPRRYGSLEANRDLAISKWFLIRRKKS